MKKIKSIAVVILVITATVFGLTACHNKKCKDGEKCEKVSCCKDEKCCDKCSDKCTTENKCCDKCKVGEEMSCCSKDCCKDCDGKDCCKEKACKEKCEKMCSEGKCCKKDSASCMKDSMHMQGMGEKKACCDKDSKATIAMYACPMHKDITSDKPGKCSKCGMELEKTK